MKHRTLALAGHFARYSGSIAGFALFVIAFGMAIEGACCCLQSERDE